MNRIDRFFAVLGAVCWAFWALFALWMLGLPTSHESYATMHALSNRAGIGFVLLCLPLFVDSSRALSGRTKGQFTWRSLVKIPVFLSVLTLILLAVVLVVVRNDVDAFLSVGINLALTVGSAVPLLIFLVILRQTSPPLTDQHLSYGGLLLLGAIACGGVLIATRTRTVEEADLRALSMSLGTLCWLGLEALLSRRQGLESEETEKVSETSDSLWPEWLRVALVRTANVGFWICAVFLALLLLAWAATREESIRSILLLAPISGAVLGALVGLAGIGYDAIRVWLPDRMRRTRQPSWLKPTHPSGPRVAA